MPISEATAPARALPQPARVGAAAQALAHLAGRTGGRPLSKGDVQEALNALCSAIAEAESLGFERHQILPWVAPAREVHRRSPFIRRLQEWPRGYAGDFETIEYLMGGQTRASLGTVEYWLEYLGLHSAIARQHRHKVGAQTDFVGSVVTDPSRSGRRVLVIACGGSPGMDALVQLARDREATIVLNDVDPAALALSRDRLEGLGDRVHSVPGNVFKVLRTLAKLGPFDGIATGGLFDYLPERAATMLLRSFRKHLLAPGGQVFFTNIATGNPQRIWMEYMTEWTLIERTESEMRRLASDGLGSEATLRLEREEAGVAWLATATAAVDG